MKQNWTYKKLGEVATFVNGYPFKPDDWEESGMPIIRIQNLNNPNATYNYYSGSIDARYIVSNGDVLISWSGTLGVYEWNENESALLNQHIFKVVFDKIPIDKVFFKYAVSSRISEMKSKVHGITMQHITKGEFDKTAIPVPPLAEQQRIVSELNLLQSIIDKQKAQLKEYDTLAQSIFYDMFGDPVENEKGWEKDILKTVAPQKQYDGTVPSIDGMVWLLNLDMVEQQTGRIIEKVLVSQDEIGNSTIVFDTTNVLYSKLRPYLNKVVLPDEIGYGTSELVPLRPNSDLLERTFLTHLLRSKSFVDFISVKVAGAKMPRVSMDVLRNYPIILPPLSLQQTFAAKIESIERQKAAISKSIAETEKLFEYTMDKYFG